MDEPVNPASYHIAKRNALLLKGLGPDGRLFSTVNHSDIRGLPTRRLAGPHDYESSGAASI
jgi:hypothetical protein